MVGMYKDIGQLLRRLLTQVPVNEWCAEAEPKRRRSKIVAAQAKQLIVGLQDLPRLLQRKLAQLRRGCAVRALDEQGASNKALQSSDLRTDGRLA